MQRRGMVCDGRCRAGEQEHGSHRGSSSSSSSQPHELEQPSEAGGTKERVGSQQPPHLRVSGQARAQASPGGSDTPGQAGASQLWAQLWAHSQAETTPPRRFMLARVCCSCTAHALLPLPAATCPTLPCPAFPAHTWGRPLKMRGQLWYMYCSGSTPKYAPSPVAK